MTDDGRRIEMANDLVMKLGGALRSLQLYAGDHPIVLRSVQRLVEALDRQHAYDFTIVIGMVDGELVVGTIPVSGATGMADAVPRLKAAGVDRIAIDRGATPAEVRTLVALLGGLPTRAGADEPDAPAPLPSAIGRHIRLGRLQVQRRIDTVALDGAAVQQRYRELVTHTEALFDDARASGAPDPERAQAIIEGLSRALMQNRTALLAVTALKYYDNYTFTHVVNVAILTMAQARSLGIEGQLLRDFGLAGFLHDIGKIRVPSEILNKTGKLDDRELALIQQHPADGAEILARRREVTPLAAVVALEHHLRLDGAGYPAIVRPTFNLATQLCKIADTYDAMRSKRSYQEASPTDRILAVLERNDGVHFDRYLVRRFCQLMGIYPPGTFVRLDTEDTAVVLRSHAPEPRRPAIRIIADREGRRLASPVDVALWAQAAAGRSPSKIVSVLDPKDIGIDPMSLLDAQRVPSSQDPGVAGEGPVTP
jgi:putative nucleotidyltransferase with HDIG domain